MPTSPAVARPWDLPGLFVPAVSSEHGHCLHELREQFGVDAPPLVTFPGLLSCQRLRWETVKQRD
jgi:hypothetical protein